MQVQDEVLEAIEGWLPISEADDLQLCAMSGDRFPRGLPRNEKTATLAFDLSLRGGVLCQPAFTEFLSWIWRAVTEYARLGSSDTVYVLWDVQGYRGIAISAASLPAVLHVLIDLPAPMAVVPKDVSWCLFFTMFGSVRFSYLDEIRRGKE